MNASAIIMLIASTVLLWGGLAAAIVHLSRYNRKPEGSAD